jgi:hypothetical protein
MQNHPSAASSRRNGAIMARPLGLAALLLIAGMSAANAATCTPTGFVRDAINLTAAQINPSGTVSGDVDATGCNIAVYYGPGSNGRVQFANVHGSNYFGIVNNGGNVSIQNSAVSNIGETPFNGTQHGVAIYFAYNSNSRGDIQGNFVWSYQKGGIVVNGPLASSNINGNTVIGLGPVDFIAQNGIQVGYGARANVQQNLVYGNAYTGTSAASGGILLVGGDYYGGPATTNVQVVGNNGFANDVGLYFSNLDASGNSVATPTRDSAVNNTLADNAVTNPVYQAGISDQGDQDSFVNNTICGNGYAAYPIDTTGSNNPSVKNNDTACTGKGGGHGNAAIAALRRHRALAVRSSRHMATAAASLITVQPYQ